MSEQGYCGKELRGVHNSLKVTTHFVSQPLKICNGFNCKLQIETVQ